nr:hypothetical protein Iba_scaffold64173CG0040 [Ipomoea batatas]GME13893.1 hypothetical protein Iba_scaffold14826CG0030 [Ipomoea batatas]
MTVIQPVDSNAALPEVSSRHKPTCEYKSTSVVKCLKYDPEMIPPEISKNLLVTEKLLVTNSIPSGDLSLMIEEVKAKSSHMISSRIPLELIAPAATKFKRIRSDWFDVTMSSSRHKSADLLHQLFSGSKIADNASLS